MHTGGTTSWSDLELPVDPLLGTSSSSSSLILPQLPLPLGSQAPIAARVVAPAVVVIEGIPPVSVKLVEKNSAMGVLKPAGTSKPKG